MSNKKEIQKQNKQELKGKDGAERLVERKVYIPRADIYTINETTYITADMPGVEEKDLDISLENDVITIHGTVHGDNSEGLDILHAEYNVGDYERSFVLSKEIDQENISATIKDGVVKITLPKSEKAKAKKIPVKSE